MTETDTLIIPDSLKGYEWRVERIWRACAGWVIQDEFDRLASCDFGEERMVDGPHFRSTILLDPCHPYLVVLQEMGRLGMMESRRVTRDGRISYRRKST